MHNTDSSAHRAFALYPVTRRRWLRELRELLAFPSVSAQPRCRRALHACARWLAAHLRRLGLRDATLLDGLGGPPSVYASWRGASGRPTLLLYGHYDVQPAEPLAAWRSPPFQATLIGQHVYARGASDDKGQLFILIKALECWLATTGHLPLNVVIWLEGEEELGSPHLAAVLSRYGAQLRADAALVCDTEMAAPNRPTILYGLRGSLNARLLIERTGGELHSGRYGGAAPNPAQVLASILAALHDDQGRVALPGFYDRVRATTTDERHALRAGGLADGRMLAQAGGARWGEAGYTPFERTSIRPALSITGLASGYTGPGAKNSIPKSAEARLNIRLVPEQEPQAIATALRHFVAARTPEGLRARVCHGGGARPVLLPREHPAIARATGAVEQVWEQPPIMTRSGGTIGPAEAFYRALGMPVIALGFGLPDDNIHAPNERLFLPNFFRGVETIVRLLAEYAS